MGEKRDSFYQVKSRCLKDSHAMLKSGALIYLTLCRIFTLHREAEIKK
jgi:hypothetical protein